MAPPIVRTISRYLLRQHVAPLGFALAALTSLMLIQQIAKQLSSLLGKGLPTSVIIEVFLLSVPFIVAVTLPMAVLVAVLHVFARLAGDNEITGLQAGGASAGRGIAQALTGAAAIALLSFLCNDQMLGRLTARPWCSPAPARPPRPRTAPASPTGCSGSPTATAGCAGSRAPCRKGLPRTAGGSTRPCRSPTAARCAASPPTCCRPRRPRTR